LILADATIEDRQGDRVTSSVRAAVAYVAGRLVSGKESSSVYSFADKDYTSLGGPVTPQSVNLFDYTHGCNISGGSGGRTFILFHTGVANYISLTVEGDSFTGHDSDSGSSFSGRVRRFRVGIYDSGANAYFWYSI
jgi:hypothetical protein